MTRKIPAMFLLVAALLIGLGSPARAEDGGILNYQIEARVTDAGKLEYSAKIELTNPAPAQLAIKLHTKLAANGDAIHNFTITDLKATSAGTDLPISIEKQSDAIVIGLDTSRLTAAITVSYVADGVTHMRTDGQVEFYWPLVQGVSLPIERVTGVVHPGALVGDYRCQTGLAGSLRTCGVYYGGGESGPDLQFEEARLAPGGVVQGTMTYSGNTIPVSERITHRWSLDRAFGHSVGNLLAGFGAAVLGLVLLAHLNRRIGADSASSEPTVIASFDSVGSGQTNFRVRGNIRPGLVGTLADEYVDPIDITATILDLAVRGHLRIIELSAGDRYDPLDWKIVARKGTDELLDYEQTLVNAIGKEGILVSEIDRLHKSVPTLQNQLYEEVMTRGWFQQRPDTVRYGFSRIGWILVGIACAILGLLVAFTSFGLLGLVLVALAAGFLALHGRMPARTASGSSALAGLRILAGQLRIQPTDEAPPGQELAELSRILPYAVVLGGAERWTQAFVAADDDEDADSEDLDWYHGPADWHLAKLPQSLDCLVTNLTGRLFRR